MYLIRQSPQFKPQLEQGMSVQDKKELALRIPGMQ
jgi:hypothetical protein